MESFDPLVEAESILDGGRTVNGIAAELVQPHVYIPITGVSTDMAETK